VESRELLFPYYPFHPSSESLKSSTKVCQLPKLLQMGDSFIWLSHFHYLMYTNIQNTSHLPWYYCSPPPNELTSRCLSLVGQCLELPRHFQTLSQRNLTILDKRKSTRTNVVTLCLINENSELKSNGSGSY